ncbi:MAG TPA: hypothetical protein VIL30_17565, partial [Ramlibacter sp.]
SLGNGPNTCSIPLAITPGVTNNALATHYGGSGQSANAVADGLRLSLSPVCMVLEQTGGQSFYDHIAAVQTNGASTPLHLIHEEL